MCDYSLEHVKSRAAVDGEELVVKQFPSGSKGFVEFRSKRRNTDLGAAFRDDPTSDCAVCCKSGVKMTLHLDDDVPAVIWNDNCATHVRHRFSGEANVVFHTVGENHGVLYHDGVLVGGNRWVSIQNLPTGTRATVTRALPKELLEAAKGGIASENDIEKRIADVAPLVTALTD